MTISEESRHRLYLRLGEVLGSDEAAVLMEHLPPVGWADVATKRDVDALETRIDLKLDSFDLKLDSFASRIEGRLERELRNMEHELRLMTWRVVLAMLTLVSVALAASRF